MKIQQRFVPILTSLLLLIAMSSCDSDDVSETINLQNTVKLSDLIANRTIETGAVIACAASDADDQTVVNVYYYLETGATDVRFFETNTIDVDANDYTNYRQLGINSQPLFEGFIQQFTRPFAEEQWVIITYELDGEVKISNPIRTKNVTKPTIWDDQVTIDQQISTMPKFTWEDNPNGDNAIYFQVVSTVDNGLLSGTYTYENQFRYYDTSNVVLNISQETPISLTINNPYKFTLMDVSEDNWVNTVIQNIFVAQ